MIKIAIVDDHKILRDGIKVSLLGNNNIKLVMDCSNAEDLLDKYPEYNPDVFIIDMSLPNMRGDELTKKLIDANSDAKILILSALTDENSVIKAVKAGAKGYLSKDVGSDELLEAIKSIFNGEEYFGGQISKLVFYSYTKINSDQQILSADKKLSERETDVIKCFADGLTYKGTGEKLFISPRTVETHKKSILKKLQLNTLADLIKYAIKNDLIDI